MGNELLITTIYATFTVIVAAAWIGGYLDKYQKMLQNLLLDHMGENRASYGLKGILVTDCSDSNESH